MCAAVCGPPAGDAPLNGSGRAARLPHPATTRRKSIIPGIRSPRTRSLSLLAEADRQTQYTRRARVLMDRGNDPAHRHDGQASAWLQRRGHNEVSALNLSWLATGEGKCDATHRAAGSATVMKRKLRVGECASSSAMEHCAQGWPAANAEKPGGRERSEVVEVLAHNIDR